MQRIKRALKKIGSKNGVRLALLRLLPAFGIPFLHVYMATPPTQDEMRIVEGRAHFQYRVKRATCSWWTERTTPARGNISTPILIVSM